MKRFVLFCLVIAFVLSGTAVSVIASAEENTWTYGDFTFIVPGTGWIRTEKADIVAFHMKPDISMVDYMFLFGVQDLNLSLDNSTRDVMYEALLKDAPDDALIEDVKVGGYSAKLCTYTVSTGDYLESRTPVSTLLLLLDDGHLIMCANTGAEYGAETLRSNMLTMCENAVYTGVQVPQETGKSEDGDEWMCPECGNHATGNFCNNCGTSRPVADGSWFCPGCGHPATGRFCNNCGMDGLAGKWKFTYMGRKIFIVFRNQTEFDIFAEGGSHKSGEYTADSSIIRMTVDGQELVSGEYLLSENGLSLDYLGTGVRTDENVRFSLRMSGDSMIDTLQNGDIIDIECKDLSEYQRGDIVAFYIPDRGDLLFVKRLIGMPGDMVEIREGYVYINGELLDEPYVSEAYRCNGFSDNYGPFTVPEGSYWIIGDRRNNSHDSRSADIGALPAEMMGGVIVAINGNPVER